MADTLCDYIGKVNNDADFAAKHNADPKANMAAFGLSDADQQVILDNNMDEMSKRCPDAVCPAGVNPIIVTYHSQ